MGEGLMEFKGNTSDLREGARIVTNMAEITPEQMTDRKFCEGIATKIIEETERDDMPRLRMKKTGEQLQLPAPSQVQDAWRQGDWRVIVMWVPDWSPNRLAGKHVVRVDCLCEEER